MNSTLPSVLPLLQSPTRVSSIYPASNSHIKIIISAFQWPCVAKDVSNVCKPTSVMGPRGKFDVA